MLDENGKYTVLSLTDAQTIVLKEAANAGIEVPSGSVEEQIENWLAQYLVEMDSALYALYVKEFNPTGTDIDIQNPGSPRLQASEASGYLEIDNTANTSPLDVTAGLFFTAPNGNVYSNGGDIETIGANETGFVNVVSVEKGKAQNLPAEQSFTSTLGVPITNPQPFLNGRDTETDTEYLSRLIFNRTNNTSQQATPAAIKELLQFYTAARIYVNNTSGDFTAPVPIPTGGYICAVIFPSGDNAGANEISNAINILANRFEFGNILRASTTLHKILSGVVYTGTFPQTFTVAVAKVVKFTLTCTLSVSFAPGTDSSEKSILASAFATQFVQNLLDFYGGAAGEFNLTFQEAGSPVPDPVVSTPSVLASNAIGDIIGPVVTIEQIRAFISDLSTVGMTPNLRYISCDDLQVILDPEEGSEPTHVLDIDAPSGGYVAVVDFVNDALFTDNTSYYDRYLFLDPALISVVINEI